MCLMLIHIDVTVKSKKSFFTLETEANKTISCQGQFYVFPLPLNLVWDLIFSDFILQVISVSDVGPLTRL